MSGPTQGRLVEQAASPKTIAQGVKK